jgi:hypothetical protein
MTPRIFVSYSRVDLEVAKFIFTELSKYGFDIFIDYERIRVGDEFPEKLSLEINICDAMLFLLSENSIKSKWVKAEVYRAFQLGKKIFILALDDMDLPEELFYLGHIQRIKFYQSVDRILQIKQALDANFEGLNHLGVISKNSEPPPRIQTRFGHRQYVARLLAELKDAGIVYHYTRHKHIHLYAERSDKTRVPIAVRGSARQGFSLYKEYEQIPDLLIAYVWGMHPNYEKVTYVLTYPQAFKILEERGFSETASWWHDGKYSSGSLTPDFPHYLEQFRMSPTTWRTKLGFLST